MNDSLVTTVADTLSEAAQAANVLATEGLSKSQYDEALQILVKEGTELAISFAVKIVVAILVFTIGKWIIGKINKGIAKLLEKKNVEPSLASFVKSLTKVVLMFILIIAIVGILGLETSSFVALFASAGVAIGMALSGTLQNFAGGVMILIFKPFKIGDFIEAQGLSGVIKEIQIFNTIITTADNKTIIVPNGGLSTGITTNYSKQPLRRVDFTFGIAYGESYDNAKEVIMGLINADSRTLKDPAPFIGLVNLGDSSVDLTVRVWCESAEYWNVFFSMNEKVYKTFTEKGINIPFPQMDVHIVK